ncbi:MAG: RecX family transcriptional regulator [Elusimicrobiota bacterium]
MKITSIQKQKRNQKHYSVFVDYKYSFSVSEETLLKSGIKDGDNLEQADIDRIAGEEQNSKAFESALHLLEYSSRSKKELKDRLLRKKLPPEAVDGALARIERIGYINDDKFAREFAQSLIVKGKGPALIRAELGRKGIPQETISEVMKGMPESSDVVLEHARAIAEKKLKAMKDKPPEVIAHRLTGFLARRGFSPDTVREILKSLKKGLENSTD